MRASPAALLANLEAMVVVRLCLNDLHRALTFKELMFSTGALCEALDPKRKSGLYG